MCHLAQGPGHPCLGPTLPHCHLLPSSIDVLGSAPLSSQRHYRNWNPPLLGNLPDDFLRILPQQLDSVQVQGEPPPACEASLLAHMVGPASFTF